MNKKSQVTLFILLGLIILFSFLSILYFVEYSTERKSAEQLEKVYRTPIPEVSLEGKCIDGTKLKTCSSKQPLYCNENGRLVDDCRRCGCNNQLLCNVDSSCRQAETPRPVKFKIYFVPINYDPDNIDFIARAAIYKEYLKRYLNLKEDNFEMVDQTLTVPKEECDKATQRMAYHVESWFNKNNGKSLPNMKVKNAIPIMSYRIIGIDNQQQSLEKCGCGYTIIYSPLVYIGGTDCSRVDHAAIHELGHTFGLCDEYDTCVWDETNEFMKVAFGHPCLNRKPSPRNSDCGLECCKDLKACCTGKYADTEEDDYYNVMGSADVPPLRRLSSETAVLINNFLCDNLDLCTAG